MARPRPRTHSGSAYCADTFRLDSVAIHDMPATILATSAINTVRDTKQDQGNRSPYRSRRHQSIWPELRFEAWQGERAANRSHAYGTQQEAVNLRTACDLRPCDEWQ